MTKIFSGAVKKVKPRGLSDNAIIPTRYELGCKDMADLMEMAYNGNAFEALALAFNFGFVMGNRATHSCHLRRL